MLPVHNAKFDCGYRNIAFHKLLVDDVVAGLFTCDFHEMRFANS